MIQCAAIRVGLLTMSKQQPARHHELLQELDRILDGAEPKFEIEQGFLTTAGRFVDRAEGAQIATESGQVAALKWPPDLYSEDLW
jgi:hypothetical protein